MAQSDGPTGKQLKLVHVYKDKMGMTEEEYRAMLSEGFGVASSKDLDRAGIDRLIKKLKSLYQSKCGAALPGEDMATQPQIDLIHDLANGRIRFLNGFMGKIVGRGVSGPWKLTKKEAINVINALMRYR